MEHAISVRKALSFGFNTCVDHFAVVFGFAAAWLAATFAVLLCVLSIISLIVVYVPHQVEFSELLVALKEVSGGFTALQILQAEPGATLLIAWSIIAGVLIYLLKELFTLGLIRIGLDLFDTNRSEVKRGLLPFKLIIRASLANALVSTIVFLGLLLFIVPGVYAALVFCFVPYFIIDNKTNSIRQAFSLSNSATKTIFFKLFVMAIFSFITVRLAPLLLFLIWLLVTPILVFAYVYLYRTQVSA